MGCTLKTSVSGVKGYDNFAPASDIIILEEVTAITMFHSTEQEKRIHAEQEIMRPGKAAEVSLCQYKNGSCVRCCLPHIGGDSHIDSSEENRYLGPGNIVMKFKNFNPLQDPKIVASHYEDSFQDVGREEMERRFSQRRGLFLAIFDREQPRQSLPEFMKAAQNNEGYRCMRQVQDPFPYFSEDRFQSIFRKGNCRSVSYWDSLTEKGRSVAWPTPWQKHRKATTGGIKWGSSIIPIAAVALAAKRARNLNS
jgi:hypothetical protein